MKPPFYKTDVKIITDKENVIGISATNCLTKYLIPDVTKIERIFSSDVTQPEVTPRADDVL